MGARFLYTLCCHCFPFPLSRRASPTVHVSSPCLLPRTKPCAVCSSRTSSFLRGVHRSSLRLVHRGAFLREGQTFSDPSFSVTSCSACVRSIGLPRYLQACVYLTDVVRFVPLPPSCRWSLFLMCALLNSSALSFRLYRSPCSRAVDRSSTVVPLIALCRL